MPYLIIFLGGGIGSMLRFAVSSFVSKKIAGDFPWYTLTVNLIGAFLIGILVELIVTKYSESQNMRYLLITGFLGGFTTFSAFSLESSLMWMKGDYASLVAYITMSVAGTIGAVLLAMNLTKVIL